MQTFPVASNCSFEDSIYDLSIDYKPADLQDTDNAFAEKHCIDNDFRNFWLDFFPEGKKNFHEKILKSDHC